MPQTVVSVASLSRFVYGGLVRHEGRHVRPVLLFIHMLAVLIGRHKEAGTGPTRLLLLRIRIVNPVNNPNSLGILPDTVLVSR